MHDFTEDDDALLAELGVDIEAKKAAARTPREERIIAGFEDIQRFVEENSRLPQHGQDKDIFERLYAVRLDRLRELNECRALLEPMDSQGLLTGESDAGAPVQQEIDDETLLAELGIESERPELSRLRHVRSSVEKQAAQDIANRQKCEDFETFKPLFDDVQKQLRSGVRDTRKFELKAEIEVGRFFIVGGQTAYVAEKGKVHTTEHGRTDARLRIIFDNGTESNMLMRSLQRALNKDDAGRRITDPIAGPLFSDSPTDGDEASGIIYVLRSKSDLPTIAANRELIHKIGVTNANVKQRIAGARLQPTFLLADVEVVAEYKLYNINRAKLEKLIHRIFNAAQLNIEIKDRFGNPVVPREWFMVPLQAINEVVARIRDNTITDYIYDPKNAELVKR